ncbi:reverse transcriptase zinc-binding domain-containing protein [Tanacetum coccineum]
MMVQSFEIKWAKRIWYSQFIPKQSFILWMAVQGMLMTCDRMVKWGSYDMRVCALCKCNSETHDHLFFNCQYSGAIWKELKHMMQFKSHATGWEDIINELAEKPNECSIWSIVKDLALLRGVWNKDSFSIIKEYSLASTIITKHITVSMLAGHYNDGTLYLVVFLGYSSSLILIDVSDWHCEGLIPYYGSEWSFVQDDVP